VAGEDEAESDTAELAAIDALSSVVLSTTVDADVLDRERRDDEVVLLRPLEAREEAAAAAVAELGEDEERERDRREDDEDDELEAEPSAVETGKLPLFCSKWNTAKLIAS